MTLDGICDHTAISADEELHQHYADLLSNADIALYGRITYQLMEYWRSVVQNPTGDKATDSFAVTMDKIPKLVFSHTLKNVEWQSATLAHEKLETQVVALKQQSGKAILVGSRSLINQLLKLNLVDELQLCVHPVLAGGGLPLFDKTAKIAFELLKTKTLHSGAIVLYYAPTQNANKVV